MVLDSSSSVRTYVGQPSLMAMENRADRKQETGPHLFEFSPAGTAFEYYAHSIGARSQSAKTYLEKNFESFEDGESEYRRAGC